MQAARLVRIAFAFVIAGCAGYLLASFLFTAANLWRLSEVGAQISFADAARTFWFDVRGLAPSLVWTQYGSLIFIGLAIAFPIAALLRYAALRATSTAKIEPFLYPLAGATAIATILVLSFQTYEVYAFAGARGWLGNLAQCFAGACAGYLFQVLMQPSEARA
ncbi:hypothetical protein JM946_18820 [Steroidobacter sp. S1-65]|uniref:Transmembrane protein n=1 Tax=Steroidobacter gossypii TaxID=2805490 RepID=A0ABS1X0Q6_9GAMM|nr:hypothetical protein [Steroidobacter gossypii]MBM0106791.1 hypothetical protein [Steroidobacter gossypii]